MQLIHLQTPSDGLPKVAQSCTQINGAEQTMYPTMTTTVSLTVLIFAREIPFTELERGKKTALPPGLSLVLDKNSFLF